MPTQTIHHFRKLYAEIGGHTPTSGFRRTLQEQADQEFERLVSEHQAAGEHVEAAALCDEKARLLRELASKLSPIDTSRAALESRADAIEQRRPAVASQENGNG